MIWFKFYAQDLGFSRNEYMLLTPGEIEDFLICRSIQNGAMREIISDEQEINDLLRVN